MLIKKLLDEINEESDDDSDEETIKKASDEIYLDDSEKFQDSDGNILEIEIRGERKCDKVYFKVKDIAVAFDMKHLYGIIIDKRTKYIKDKHYEYFICVFFGDIKKKTNKKAQRNYF